jgi:hypothetical protein
MKEGILKIFQTLKSLTKFKPWPLEFSGSTMIARRETSH